MSSYKFLIKPLFFIFNLVFATWLVLMIENVKPSDFGKYSSIFESKAKLSPEKKEHKRYLENLFSQYKRGEIDSVELGKKLEKYLLAPNIVSLRPIGKSQKK
jgi:hypothetical protein